MYYRFAEEKDTALILKFIRALAEYEKMADQVVAAEPMKDWTVYRIAGDTLARLGAQH